MTRRGSTGRPGRPGGGPRARRPAGPDRRAGPPDRRAAQPASHDRPRGGTGEGGHRPTGHPRRRPRAGGAPAGRDGERRSPPPGGAPGALPAAHPGDRRAGATRPGARRGLIGRPDRVGAARSAGRRGPPPRRRRGASARRAAVLDLPGVVERMPGDPARRIPGRPFPAGERRAVRWLPEHLEHRPAQRVTASRSSARGAARRRPDLASVGLVGPDDVLDDPIAIAPAAAGTLAQLGRGGRDDPVQDGPGGGHEVGATGSPRHRRGFVDRSSRSRTGRRSRWPRRRSGSRG